MPQYLHQSSFAGGEFSPDAQARVDIDKYKTGAKTLRNFIVTQKGVPQTRPGTHFVSVAKYSDRAARLIPFVFSTDAAYMLEFGDEYIRFYKNGGQILEDTNNSVIPFWASTLSYNIGDYAMDTRVDYTIHLYRSLINSNTVNKPEVSPTKWQDIGEIRQWNSAVTYSSGDYVYQIRTTDGKRKLYISAQNSNLNHDPNSILTYWSEAKPANYNASTTYSIGDYISVTDQFGNVSIYRSMRDNNTGHDIYTEGLWWQFWNGPLTWSSGTTYAAGDYVIRFGSGVYKSFLSLQGSNLGQDPLSASVVYWTAFDSPAAYEIESPYAQEDIDLLKYVQSADTLYIVHPNYKPKTLQRISDNDWTLADYAYENGPFRIGNSDTNKTLRVYLDGTDYKIVTAGSPGYDYFTSDMEGALFQLNYFVAANHVHDVFTSAGQSDQLTCGGTWRLVTGGLWDGTLLLEKSIDNGATWSEVGTFRNPGDTDVNFNTFGTIDNDGDPFLLRITLSAHDAGNVDVTLSADEFTQVGVFRLDTVTDARNGIGTPIKNILLSGTESFTSDWAEGAWSNYRGWPETVAFAQDRLVFGGNTSEPQTVWMTKSSNYVDFGRSIPLVDSDGITINLLSRQINRIRSLVSFLNSVIAFTGSSEFSIEGISDGPLTPTNVFTKLQGLRGTGDIDPILVGNHIIFISPLSTAVRDMIFNVFNQSFDTANISTLSDHLIKDSPIVAMAYQQEPDSVIWMVREDGKLVSVTYSKEQEMNAWTRHDTDNGLFESVATIPGSDADEVWFIVKRGSLRFIERMLARTSSTDPADQYFVDSGLSYDGAPASVLTGLDHLNGLQVTINAEGFILPNQTVSNGQITLDQARSKVIAGLPITPDVETLNVDVPLRDGTSQGRRYHIGSCNIRFLNSRGGQVGMDSDNLDTVIDERDPALAAATPTPLFTGWPAKQITIKQSDDGRGHLMIRQNEPMPMTILAITLAVDQGDKL
jgi:hypothetical protein